MEKIVATLIYLHGFLSSHRSKKALQTESWIAKNYPAIRYRCPDLPAYPDQSHRIIEREILNSSGRIYLIGSSLGGFWATYFSERFALPAVLINPAVQPSLFQRKVLNQPLRNYSSDEVYRLTEKDVMELARYRVESISRPELLAVLLQTGDQTLDYRLAEQAYASTHLVVEKGGSHSFEQYQRWLPKIMCFFETGMLTEHT